VYSSLKLITWNYKRLLRQRELTLERWLGGLLLVTSSFPVITMTQITNAEGAVADQYMLSDSQIRVRFEWGETVAYGNSTAYQYGITGAFSANLSGLDPAKTYHYRAVVEVRGDSRVGVWDAYYGEDAIVPSTGGMVGGSIADRLAAEGAI